MVKQGLILRILKVRIYNRSGDQAGADVVHLLQLFFVTVGAGSACGPAVPNRTDAAGPRMESLLCSNENIF